MKKQPRDVEYENWLCNELFKLGFLSQPRKTEDCDRKLVNPQAISVTCSVGHGEVRERIRENLDFLSMSMRYNVFDLEATRRELAEAKN